MAIRSKLLGLDGIPEPSSSQATGWGQIVQFNQWMPEYFSGGAWRQPTPGMEYGGSGLIYLGNTQYGQLDESLQGASKLGTWDNLRGTFQNQLNEVAGISGDAYATMTDLYDRLNTKSAAGEQYNLFGASGGNFDGYFGPPSQYDITRGLDTFAKNRREYDNLVTQFNQTYTGAVQAHQQREREHKERLAELDRQRQASEAAAARSRAWQSNMTLQNRQNENLPDTITAGTADSADGGSDMGGDVGGRPRRRRGSLSSNLGINA